VPAPAAGCVLGAAAYLPDGGDLWGDEGDATVLFGDEDPALDAANERRLAAIREAQRAKRAEERALAVQSGASRVVLDVKPWDDSTDLAEMERQVRRLRHPTQPEAIQWQVAQREDVGYGLHKLRIMCQVVDEVVSVEDDLVARIEGLEEWVQSCDVFGFNNQ
jgi:elongation factor 1-beta